jgi:Protein of unknown function (DUF2628)
MLFGHRMRMYSVLLNPKEKHSFEHAQFIPEGFCLYGFIFSGFWACAHRAWKLAALFFLCIPCGEIIATSIGFHPASVAIISLGLRVFIGLRGYDLLRNHYLAKGWIVSDVIVAYNELEAMHRYYERHMIALNHELSPLLSHGVRP